MIYAIDDIGDKKKETKRYEKYWMNGDIVRVSSIGILCLISFVSSLDIGLL